MPLNGASGTKNIADFSCHQTAFTVIGAPKLSGAKSKFRETSLYFDGSGGYVGWGSHIGTGKVGALMKLYGDFTIEMWVNTENYSTQRPFLGTGVLGANGSIISQAMSMYFNQSGQLCMWSTWGEIFGSTQAAAGSWHHVAICRNAGVMRMFLNGVQQGSTLPSSVLLAATDFALGATVDVAYHPNKYRGYLAEFRVYHNIGIYTSNFQPPGILDLGTAQVVNRFAEPKRSVSVEQISVKLKPAASPFFASNLFHGGPGHIAGVVDRAGSPVLPVRCRVRLQRSLDGMVVQDTFSDVNGAYVFNNVAMQTYYVTAFDPAGTSNAVIADQIVPEVL